MDAGAVQGIARHTSSPAAVVLALALSAVPGARYAWAQQAIVTARFTNAECPGSSGSFSLWCKQIDPVTKANLTSPMLVGTKMANALDAPCSADPASPAVMKFLLTANATPPQVYLGRGMYRCWIETQYDTTEKTVGPGADFALGGSAPSVLLSAQGVTRELVTTTTTTTNTRASTTTTRAP